jgi:hypothetical protein
VSVNRQRRLVLLILAKRGRGAPNTHLGVPPRLRRTRGRSRHQHGQGHCHNREHRPQTHRHSKCRHAPSPTNVLPSPSHSNGPRRLASTARATDTQVPHDARCRPSQRPRRPDGQDQFPMERPTSPRPQLGPASSVACSCTPTATWPLPTTWRNRSMSQHHRAPPGTPPHHREDRRSARCRGCGHPPRRGAIDLISRMCGDAVSRTGSAAEPVTTLGCDRASRRPGLRSCGEAPTAWPGATT